MSARGACVSTGVSARGASVSTGVRGVLVLVEDVLDLSLDLFNCSSHVD